VEKENEKAKKVTFDLKGGVSVAFQKYIPISLGGRANAGKIITITKDGIMGVGQACIQEYHLAKYDYAWLYWDAERKAIGIKFVTEADDETLKISRRGRGDKTSGTQISVRGFVRHYGLQHTQSRRYKATWEDGMLVAVLGD